MDKHLRLQVILSALDKASKPLRTIESHSGAAGRALKAARDNLKALNAAQRDVAAYRGLKTAQQENARALDAARIKAQELARAHAATANPTRKMTTELARARDRVRQLKTAQGENVQKLNEVRGKLDAAGVSTRNLARDELHLRESIRRANTEIENQKAKLNQLGDVQRRQAAARASAQRTEAFAGRAAGAGAVSMAAGVGLAAPLVLAGRAAIDFERAMSGVKKVVDFPTPAAFSQMSRDILDLSGRIPVAATELAGLVAQGARAGVARKDLIAFAEAAAMMGVAFDVSAEQAGEMMAVWRTAFGLNQDEVIELASQVNYLTNEYGGNAAKVSEMITRVGPLADVAGASSSVLAALAQVMNSVGVEAEVGGTAIKNMLLGLTKGTAATKKQQQAFAALGLDAGQVARQMQTDAEGAITGVLQAVARLPKEQQLAVLGQLFGTESVAAIAPMLSQLGLVERNLRDVGDASVYAGSMQAEFAGSIDNTAARMDQAGNKAVRMATILGQKVKPYVDMAARAIGGAADAIAAFAERHPRLTAAAMALLGVVAGLFIVFGGLALSVAAILAPFALLQTAWAAALPLILPIAAGLWGLVTATWAWTAALLANPATWVVMAIVAAIAALVAIAYVLHRNWGAVSAWFAGVWNRLKTIVVQALDVIARAILAFTPLGLFIRAFSPIWPYLTGLRSRFAEMGRELIAGLIRGVLAKLDDLRRTITDAASKAAKWFKEKMGIHSPSRVFMDFGGHTMGGLALGIERARDKPLQALSAVGGAMTSALALSAGPTLAAPAAGQSAQGGDTYNITVNAAAGADPQAIADQVMREIQARQASRRRSEFRDDDE